MSVEGLMWKCSGNCGVDVGSFCFTDIDHADDAAYPASMWWCTDQLRSPAANLMGLHITWLETEIQYIGAEPIPQSIPIGNQTVKSVT